MASVITRRLQQLSAAAVGIGIFIFNEAIIIFVVHAIGPWWTTALYTVVFGGLSIVLFDWFEHAAAGEHWMGRSVRWFIAQATAWRTKYRRLVETSSILAIAVAAILAGSFVSAILTGLLGYRGRRARWMIALEALGSALFWSMFYAGLLHFLFRW